MVDTLTTKNRSTKVISIFNGARVFKNEDSKVQRNQPTFIFLLDEEGSVLNKIILQKGMI